MLWVLSLVFCGMVMGADYEPVVPVNEWRGEAAIDYYKLVAREVFAKEYGELESALNYCYERISATSNYNDNDIAGMLMAFIYKDVSRMSEEGILNNSWSLTKVFRDRGLDESIYLVMLDKSLKERGKTLGDVQKTLILVNQKFKNY